MPLTRPRQKEVVKALSRKPLKYIAVLALAALSSNIFAGESSSSNPATTPIWPMPARTDFSSGFGDYRTGRFHYGLDLRTGDNRLAVVAPVDGHVSQVWVQYFGYGKALYLSGDDGRTYVFAHLARYSPRINRVVRGIQIKKKRYFIHEWFEPDQFRVRQGDTLAFSGKTGIGAPHMHFEVRGSDNVPRSPLQQGLHIDDRTGPRIKSLTFRYLDYESLFATGKRTKTLECTFVGLDGEGAARYNLSAFPYLSAPFGVVISASDYPTNDKFDASPRIFRYRVGESSLKDTIPDVGAILYRTLFARTLDSLSYGAAALSLDVYDQSQALLGDKSSYLLYQRLTKRPPSAPSDSTADSRPGRFPVYLTRPVGKLYGVYPARIDVTDASGNRSTLDYSFCYGPAGDLFKVADIGANFALLTTKSTKLLQKRLLFAELVIYELNDNGGWKPAEKATVSKVGKGAFRVTIGEQAHNRKRVYRAVLKGRDGWYKPDVIFSNLPAPARMKVKLSYELADAGLYVRAKVSSPTTDKPQIQALTVAGRRQELAVRQVGARVFSSYTPFNKAQQTIVTLRAYSDERAKEPADEISGLRIGVPRPAPASTTAGDSEYRIKTRGVCYAPLVDSGFERLLEWSAYDKHVPEKEALLAGPFYFGPRNVRYDVPALIRMNADTAVNPALNVAICKLSDKGDRWIWSETVYDEDSFSAPFVATISSNGLFALMIDTIAPSITKIRPANGSAVRTALPKITARIADELSGIWVDTLFNVQLDGEWLIPEYDNEDQVLETQPNHPLKPGDHALVIRVRDNAGNQSQREVTFRVQ